MKRLAGVVAVLAPLVVAANLRAPGHVDAAPSGALAKPEAAVSVKSETLTVRCEPEACEVEARYAILAERALETSLELLAPAGPAAKGPVTALVNGQLQPAAGGSTTADPGHAEKDRHGDPLPLFQARFPAPLVAGANEIVVRYRQPLAADEHDYGYFKKGRWTHRFRYELWPLKGWRLAPGFALALEVSMDRPAPGFWARHFGTMRSLACTDPEEGKKLPGTPVQEGDRLVQRTSFGAQFPDRFACTMADEDLLPP